MKDYKRKDKLLITMIVLSCLMLSVANPANYDIRMIVWNMATLIVLVSTLLWIISEVGDLITTFAFRWDDPFVRRKEAKQVLEFIPREDLVNMAADVSSRPKSDMAALSDDELISMISASSAAEASIRRKNKLSPIKIIYRLLKFVYYTVRIVTYDVTHYIKDKEYRKHLKRNKMTIDDMREARRKIIDEFEQAKE